VQVEGEDAIGEEKLQEGDSVQAVVERAVEKERIESIRWKDVAGWQLRESRQRDARQIASGTSSERLVKLLPFPEESLLTITRRIALSTASYPSSSSVSSSSSSSTSSTARGKTKHRREDSICSGARDLC
jgi:hypothetical protein